MRPGEETPPVTDVQTLGAVELFARCAQNTDDSALWSEFMRRYGPRIQGFIRRTLTQTLAADSSPSLRGIHESDLLQSTVVRLVENGCAAMKRFSGSSEEEILPYLAVITRSVVRDSLRRQRALKRPVSESELPSSDSKSVANECTIERELLAREVTSLSLRAIETQTGEFSARDRLIFQLYFFHDLSMSEIARCQGIGLSKTGVESVLQRLRDLVRRAVGANGPFEATMP